MLKLPRFLPAARLTLLLLPGLTTGCATRSPESFSSGRPVMDPGRYFAGHTHSWGVFESPSRQPTKLFGTVTDGHWQNGVLHFEQDINFAGGKTSHRSWLIRRVDAHHYTATGTGIVGTAHGEAYGNLFYLHFTMDLSPGNPLAHVGMTQWMYLQPDGRTMVNCDRITKAGVTVAEITEQFQKDR